MDGLYTIIRVILAIAGILMLLMGLLWIGQGTGLIMWPKSSFMLNQVRWAFNGALLANFGLLQIYIVRRR